MGAFNPGRRANALNSSYFAISVLFLFNNLPFAFESINSTDFSDINELF